MHAWEKWHTWNEDTMAPVTAWFVEASGARPGATLLDVACGTGIPSLALARRTGPTGKVIATDHDADMLEAARRIASSAGLSNLEHLRMDMGALSFDDARFDGATAAFGLMFVPDPAGALRELARVAKPGAPVAFAVWAEASQNRWLTSLFEPLRRVVPSPAPPPEPPSGGPFRLADESVLRELCRGAGLHDIRVVTRPIHARFASIEAHWEVMSDMAAPLRAAASALPAKELDELRSAIAAAIAPFVVDGQVILPGAALCAVGIR